MIRIDHIAFDFTAPDEAFARGLYADWDGFCRRCFERVAEECLAPYGADKALHELERLDLDLGSIPEEDLYSEFPRRLREALLDALPPLHTLQIQASPEKTAASRMNSLLFYLEQGHPLPEWADEGFNPQEETDRLTGLSADSYHTFIRKAAILCLKREHALRRLLHRTDNYTIFLDLYAAALAEPSAGQAEKRRMLVLLLEERPDVPVRYVHCARGDGELRGMADLLDSLSVRHIIRTETKEHAEVDLPPYWHYLYEWLVKYYPYNGIAMFGGKSDFIRHLHFRLLTFIRGRSGAPYLSKEELTAGFLLEVFGAAYYKDVLNAIYRLQPHTPDGSPVYDGYLNMELYRTFLRLSLLRLPEVTGGNMAAHEDRQNDMALPFSAEAFTAWLKDTSQSRTGKREQLMTLAKGQPEMLVKWLQTEGRQDDALLSLLAELAEDATLYRLIAVLSFAASETAKAVQGYIKKHKQETGWLEGLSDSRLAQAFKLSVFRWLASGKDDAGSLLRNVYSETTGKEDDAAVETLAREMERDSALPEEDERSGKGKVGIRHLQTLLSDPTLSDTLKRRMVAHFWDNYREDYAQAVRLLQEQDMLDEVSNRTDRYAWETILYRMLRQAAGMEKASDLMPLCRWLANHEAFLSYYYPADTKHGLRAGLLLGIVRLEREGQDKSLKDTVHFLLVSLFRKSTLPSILKQMVQDTASETTGASDAEQAFSLSDAALNGASRDLPSLFQEWKHSHEGVSDTLRTLFESRWHTAEVFAVWLDDTSQTVHDKRELLREAATEKLSEWLSLLRALPEGSKALASLETMLTAHDLLASIAQANFHQASVLSRVIERLRHPVVSLSVSLTDSGIPLETFLRKTLLAYLQDPKASGRTLSEREITDKFLSYLRLATTGKEQAEADAVQWKRLAEAMADSPSEYTGSLPKEKLLQALSAPSASHIALRQALVRLMDRQPDGLLIWLEQNTDTNKIYRMAEISDGLMTSHWTNRLAAMPGFAHPDAFRQLTAWLLRRLPATELAAALFLYVKEPGWRTFTPEQMEAYFFSRLYGKTHAPSIEETLSDESLPRATRQRLFRHNLRYRPEQLLAFIREAVRQNSLPLNRWLEWTDASDWLQLAAGLSLAKAELLRQITDILSLPEEERKKVLATYIIYGDTEEWPYDTPRETVRSFVETLPSMQGEDADVLTATVRKVERELDIPEEQPETEETHEVLSVGNAGLCLLAPWFIRLFSMLGYLDEERKKFRNTASKVRAVFLLQYLVCGEERDWREPELAFNRLLTALPGHVPLPRRLALTGEERQTADGMMAGVKANWPQMNGTSVQGFRYSFIARNGLMEQEEERWLLTVEEKAYDVLLDTVPWGFRQIRLPWLKKYVQVKWQEKQTF